MIVLIRLIFLEAIFNNHMQRTVDFSYFSYYHKFIFFKIELENRVDSSR